MHFPRPMNHGLGTGRPSGVYVLHGQNENDSRMYKEKGH